MGIRTYAPVPPSIAIALIMALQDLIPEVAEEVRQRQEGGNDEAWEDLHRKVEYAQAAMQAAATVIAPPLPADNPHIVAAIEQLDGELTKLGLSPLDSEQRYAMRDSFQSFNMLDDLEARVIGASVFPIRRLLARALREEDEAKQGEEPPAVRGWSARDDGFARREGWLMAVRDDGRAEIQRLDEAAVFDSDAAAVAHVYAKALEHRAAELNVYSRAIAHAHERSVRANSATLADTIGFIAIGAHQRLGELPMPEAVHESVGGFSEVMAEILLHAPLLDRMARDYWPEGCPTMYQYEVCEPFGAALYTHIACGLELDRYVATRAALDVISAS